MKSVNVKLYVGNNQLLQTEEEVPDSIADINGLQDALNAKQSELIAGNNITLEAGTGADEGKTIISASSSSQTLYRHNIYYYDTTDEISFSFDVINDSSVPYTTFAELQDLRLSLNNGDSVLFTASGHCLVSSNYYYIFQVISRDDGNLVVRYFDTTSSSSLKDELLVVINSGGTGLVNDNVIQL